MLYGAHEGLPRQPLQMAIDKCFIMVVVQTSRQLLSLNQVHSDNVICMFTLANNKECSLS